ncbi:MAG: translocation/assembly module TamB [Chlorobiaceae bacterium]|nr:translocation/assembly module TamB [Chlorobiaceae bacterium]
MERVRTYTIRLLAAFSAGLLVLAIVAAAVVNSGAFNVIARQRLAALFNEQYRGRLQIREVRLNFPDRVTLVAPAIYEEKVADPALSASRVSGRFNFLSLLKPKLTTLSFNDLEVDGFRGRIVEAPDGKLNIERIFTERDPNKPKTMEIEHVRCRHASFRNASLFYAPKDGEHYDIRSLYLEASRLLIGDKELMGAVSRLEFAMPDRGFRLRKGSGTLSFSEARSEAIGLDLQTDRSRAQLSLSFDGLDIFSGITLRKFSNSPAFLHVESIQLHSEEINRLKLLPALPDGIYTIRGDARGTLEELHILPVVAEHDGSRVAFQGELLNLPDPQNFSFKLQFDKSRISSELLGKVAGSDNLRRLARESGGIGFSGIVQGKPERWLTDVAFDTKIGSGSVAVDAKRLAEGRYQAEGTFALEKALPNRLLGIEKVDSGFSGSGSFLSAFTSAGAVESAHLEAKVSSASWQLQKVSAGSIVMDYSGNMLTAKADLQNTDGSALDMTGSVDLATQGVPGPSYRASGTMRRLDLSKAAGSGEFTTSLSGTFDIRGQGFDPSLMNLHADMVFTPSSINDFEISDRSTVSLGIVQSPASSSLNLASSFMDLTLQGNASLGQVLGTVRLASACVSREFGNSGPAPAALPATPFAFDYRMAVRDVAPLAPLLGTREFRFRGTASGRASWAGGVLSLDADTGIGRLESGKSLGLADAAFKGTLRCGPTGISAASLSGTAGTATVAGKELKSLQIGATYANGFLNASLDLAVPQYEEKLSAVIQARRSGQFSTVTFRKLALSTPNGTWQASPDATIDVAPSYVRFNRLGISKGGQSVEFDGLLSSSQPGTFQCNLSNIELDELKQFLLDRRLDLLSGRANARITVSGSAGSKTSSLDLRASGVAYNELRFGSVHLTAGHSGDRLRFDIESRNPQGAAGQQSVNTITGTGTVPLILGFSPFRLEVPERRPLDVTFHSDDLSAKFLVYAIPLFDDAEGVIPTDVRISGSFPRPEVFLTSQLNDTRLRVEPTQVPYFITGQVNGTPSRIDLGSLKIRDTLQGRGTISGIVRLDGLEPKSVDLSGTCRNLLVYSKKDRKDDTSFGTIQGSTDSFRFSGDLSAPTAEGEFNITAADFSIYRTGSNESAKYIGVEKFIEFVPRYPSAKPASVVKAAPARAPEFNQALLDILQISRLRLTSYVPVRFNVIFDRIRGERLETAVSNMSLNIGKVRQRFNLFGSVDIVGGKYTFSNSYFDLENGGRVAWNSEEIRNGALENLYGVKLVSASDVQTGERDNVKLLLAIGGTINEPNVRMGYYLNDDIQPYASSNSIGRQSSHIDPNADLNVISMLLSRQWYLHPERQGRTGSFAVSSVGVSAGTGLLSSQISGLVQGLAGLESFNLNMGTDSNGQLRGIELYVALQVPGTGGKVRFIGTGSTPTGGTGGNTALNTYGSSQKIEYRVSPKVYVQAYRSYGQSGSEGTTTNLQTPTENWGASVAYRERFHTWNQFWHRLFGGGKGKEKKAEAPAPAPAMVPTQLPQMEPRRSK